MKKLWMIVIFSLLIISSVLAVRTEFNFGNVPSDSGAYLNDSYLAFGSNVNKQNITGTSCNIADSSPQGVYVADFDGNAGNGDEIATLGAGTISFYRYGCVFVNTTSIGGSMRGTAQITNIDSDGFQELTFAVYDGVAGRVEMKSFEFDGSSITKIFDFPFTIGTGDLSFIGTACNVKGSDTYCVGLYQSNLYRINMTYGGLYFVDISSTRVSSDVQAGYTATTRNTKMWLGDFNSNSSRDDDMMIGITRENIASNGINNYVAVYEITTLNQVFTNSDLLLSEGGGGGVGIDGHSGTEMYHLLGSRTTALGYGESSFVVNNIGQRYEDFAFYNNVGTRTYHDQAPVDLANWGLNPPVPPFYFGEIKGTSAIVSGELSGAGTGNDDYCYLRSSDAHVICIDNSATLVRDWVLSPYVNDTKNYMPLAMGDVVSGANAQGKEIITTYGIYNNTGALLYSFPFNSTSLETIQLIDSNNNNADEIYLSKKAGGVKVYDASTILIPSPPPVITNTTPFICDFDSDTVGFPPQSCVKEDYSAFSCVNPVSCNTGIDNSVFNSTPQSLAMRTNVTDEIFIYNNTIGNETGFLRIEFSLYNQFINPVNSYLSINTYEDNPNAAPSYGTLVDTAAMYENGTITDGGFTMLCSPTLPFNKWVDIKYEMNLTSGFSKMYYNFSSCGIQHTFSNNHSATHVQSFSIGSHQGFGFNIDNLRINEPPNVAPAPVTTTTSVVTTTVPPTTTTTLGGGGFCPNTICESGESHASCPADCPILTCGDGICDTANGETRITCPIDCSETGINSLVAPDDASRGFLPEIASGLTMFITHGINFFWVVLIIGFAVGILLLFTALGKMLSQKR